MNVRLAIGVLLPVLTAAAVALIIASRSERGAPARCPPGLVARGARCCGGGQQLRDGRCVGRATTCAASQLLLDGRCTAKTGRVVIEPTELSIEVSDWDLEGHLRSRTARVERFAIERTEVSNQEWGECVAAQLCRSLGEVVAELPVVSVSAAEADVYCRFRGGQLPTAEQWLAAAVSAENRRYPWGAFGLVCRRAAFGLVDGPCGRGGTVPDVPGSRPDGATAQGLLDLAGNVAEWTLNVSPSGERQISARGGSFRSTLASELKGLGAVELNEPRDDVGFRCAFVAADHSSQ